MAVPEESKREMREKPNPISALPMPATGRETHACPPHGCDPTAGVRDGMATSCLASNKDQPMSNSDMKHLLNKEYVTEAVEADFHRFFNLAPFDCSWRKFKNLIFSLVSEESSFYAPYLKEMYEEIRESSESSDTPSRVSSPRTKL